jgi:Rha family phage regulatory protein
MKLVIVKNNKAVANSRNIAKKFRKKHKYVVRSIETLIKKGIDNYEKISITNSLNQPGKSYLMDGDGFFFLADYFTDKGDLDLKRHIMQEFFDLRDKLKEQQELNPAELLLQQEQRLVDNERKITELEENAEYNFPADEFFTIKTYCNVREIKLLFEDFLEKRKEAIDISNEHDVTIEKIKDKMYGNINKYHIDILDSIFEEDN